MYQASAYYDTDIWSESGNKFSRTYCIATLNELCKINNNLLTSPQELKTQDEYVK